MRVILYLYGPAQMRLLTEISQSWISELNSAMTTLRDVLNEVNDTAVLTAVTVAAALQTSYQAAVSSEV